jgi:hypothetical protein
MSEAYVLARSEERLRTNRQAQIARINVKGVFAQSRTGEYKSAKARWNNDLDGWPIVVVNTPEWGEVTAEISWDLLDSLSDAASKGNCGTVHF